MNTMSNSGSDLVVYGISAYSILLFFIPIMIFIMTCIMLFGIFVQLHITERLTQILTKLDDINESVMYGPLPKDEYNEMINQRIKKEEKVKSTTPSWVVVVLGVVIGMICAASGFFFDGGIKYGLILAGGLIAVTSILTSIIQGLRKEKIPAVSVEEANNSKK